MSIVKSVAILSEALSGQLILTQKEYDTHSKKTEYMCISVRRAARFVYDELNSDEADILVDEIADMIGGKHTLQDYLKSTYGITDDQMSAALTQPFRIAMLTKLRGKYQKLIDAERTEVSKKIELLEEVKVRRANNTAWTRYVCLNIQNVVDDRKEFITASDTIRNDINTYLKGHKSMEAFLESTTGEYSVTNSLVERNLMIDALINDYKKKLEALK
jgi:predicted nucleic-acid-binding protein